MKGTAYRLYGRVCDAATLPLVARDLLTSTCGREYGVTLRQKVRLIRSIRQIARSVVGATSWQEHLLLVARVLSIPADLKGDVIECGCFKGSSTASLSLACALTGRRLVVCDSFAGLPPIAAHDVVHVSEAAGRYETYAEGEYAGSLEEVRANVGRFGALEVCDFVKGYFETTPPTLDRSAVLVFLDVDLHESLKTCLINLWPKICNYGYLYTHEALQLEYVSLFFDKTFWAEMIGAKAPGLIGAGSGLPTGIARSCGLGYTQKLPVRPERDDDARARHFCGDPTRRAAVQGSGGAV